MCCVLPSNLTATACRVRDLKSGFSHSGESSAGRAMNEKEKNS